MSDGSIKRMPKEDMATVLGGLIDPLCNKGFVSVVNNSALTIWTTGIYGVSFVDTAVTPDMQYPSFTGEIYGTLIVSKGGDLLSQTLITNQGIWARGHTYRRFQETNVPWIKL